MVFDKAKPRYQRSTTRLGMRGRELQPPKVDILQVSTIDFSEFQLIVKQNSKTDGQNKKCKEMDEFAKENHACLFFPKEYRRYKGQWGLILKNRKKMEFFKFRSDFRAAVLMKNRLHHESGEQVEVTFHRGQCSRRHHSASLFKHTVVGQV